MRPIQWTGRVLSSIVIAAAVALQSAPSAAQSGPESGPTDTALQAVLDQIPRHRFDLDALLSSLPDATPQTLFEFVRDETRLVPYVGMLRGSRGVLMDGLGNSLDRAILLAELLRRTGVEVRLARGALQLAEARSVVEQQSQADRPSGVPSLAAHEQTMAAALGTGDAPNQEVWTNPIAGSVDRQVAALRELLGNSLAEETDVDSAAMALALTDHWWVQFEAEGSWLDLDPNLIAGRPGEALTGAVELWPVNPAQAAELAVPQEHWHQFSLRIVVERASDGVLSEVTVLNADIVPALVMEAPIAMQMVPIQPPGADAVSPDAVSIEAVAAAALAAEAWIPVLMVGEGALVGEKFNAVGLAAADGPSGGSGLLGPMVDVLSEATAALSEEGELTAVFADYVFSQPGAQDETIRRSMLDLIGPAARASHQDGLLIPGDWQPDDSQRRERALALTERIEIVPQIAAFDPALRSAMLVNALRSILAAQQPNSNAGEVSPMPGAASLLAILRRDWNPLAEELFIDRINMLTAHHRLAGLDPTTGWSVELGLDIVRNDIAPTPWTTLQPTLLRLQQGVVDTNAEAALLRSTAIASNAGLSYSADLARGASWLIVASIEQLPEGIPGDTAAMIRGALSAGDLAVVPAVMIEAVGMPWWRIDASTGTALGIGPRGWGENIAEYPALRVEDIGEVKMPEFLVVVSIIFICEIVDTYSLLTSVDEELVTNYLACARIPD